MADQRVGAERDARAVVATSGHHGDNRHDLCPFSICAPATVLVTGANSGIGFGMADAFALCRSFHHLGAACGSQPVLADALRARRRSGISVREVDITSAKPTEVEAAMKRGGRPRRPDRCDLR